MRIGNENVRGTDSLRKVFPEINYLSVTRSPVTNLIIADFVADRNPLGRGCCIIADRIPVRVGVGLRDAVIYVGKPPVEVFAILESGLEVQLVVRPLVEVVRASGEDSETEKNLGYVNK